MPKKARSKKPSRRPPGIPAPGSPEAVAIRRGARAAKLRAYRAAAEARLAAKETVKPDPAAATLPVQNQDLALADLGAEAAVQQGLPDDLAFDDGAPHPVRLGDRTFTRVRLTARGRPDTIRARIGGGDSEAGAVVAQLQTALSEPMTLAMARAGLAAGRPWLHWWPLLMVGPPGTGKSRFAHLLAEGAGLPALQIDGASITSPAPLIGVDGSWRTGRPSLIALALSEHNIANPVVIVDEVDKLAAFGTNRTASADAILLGLLEAETAARFADSFIRQPVNLGFLNWILTANDLDAVSAPLRDRCTVVTLAPADFAAVARRQIDKRGLNPELLEPLLRGFRQNRIKSLRKLNKVLDAAEAALARPMLN